MVHSNSKAFVTLTTSDEYALGAIVLAHSLRDVGTRHALVCLVTSQVSTFMQSRLRDVFDVIVSVSPIMSSSRHELALLGRPDLAVTFTKLHIWSLTQYSTVCFLDADTLVLQAVDDLFDLAEHHTFSACPDIGWPDCFNSGVFVTKPALDTYEKLTAFADSNGSFDGGDQGLLNEFFRDWHRLPFIYNVTPSTTYSYSPAFQKFGKNIKIVHFIGMDKPWRWSRFTDGSVMPQAVDALDLIRIWWSVHDRHIGRLAAPVPSAHSGGVCGDWSYGQLYASGPQFSFQHGSHSDSAPLNPFFKSRYDWNEAELGIQGAGSNSKHKTVLADADDDEDDHGARSLPLKKPLATAGTSAAAVKLAGPPKAKPSSGVSVKK